MKQLSILIIAALLSFGSAQDFVMGINFDAGGKFDRSFNEGTWNGFSRAIEELGAQYDIEMLEFEGTPATSAQGLREMASQGAELIIAPGFAQTDAIVNLAAEFPDTVFVNIDGWSPEPRANELYVGFAEHEGSFLVGYIAGSLSQTGVVGFVGGMDIPLIRKFNLGYEEGVLAACPDCRVISNYVGTTPSAWNDPARAKELASAQRAQGADIIYAAAGASGNGVIDFVNENLCYMGASRETALTSIVADMSKSAEYNVRCAEGSQPLFFIGVDSNQNFLGDTDSNPATLNHGLTSMLKRVDVAAYNAVYDVVNGTFEGGYLTLDLASEGVGYAIDEYNEALIPASLIEELEAIRAQIIAGELVVTDFTAQ
ncbi:MAG: BMP family ABC transporter substrate-binding protein [Chloroflexi bacterium AL-N5]|nr:BMP family ABC transporter substrate-binding protein [Chloroflexi bacterium AL-N5]